MREAFFVGDGSTSSLSLLLFVMKSEVLRYLGGVVEWEDECLDLDELLLVDFCLGSFVW